MKARSFLLAAMTAGAILCGAVTASAEHDGVFSVYPVDSDGSTTAKTTFNPGETPYIYVHLPNPGLNAVGAFWQDPGTKIYFNGAGPSIETQYWFSLDNGVDENGDPVNWASVQKAGDRKSVV